MSNSITKISKEPKVAKNAIDLVSRINPKYHFPGDCEGIERQMRICLGLPFFNRLTGQTAYGYTYNKETDTYEPIEDIFKLLWEARRYLYTSSIREVADWVNAKAEKLGYTQTISYGGLRNLMILRPPLEECLLPIAEKEKILESLIQWNKTKTQMT